MAFIEPLTCILIGGLLTYIHIYLGLPFLTSISFFCNEVYQIYLNTNSSEQQIKTAQALANQMQLNRNTAEHFHEVI